MDLFGTVLDHVTSALAADRASVVLVVAAIALWRFARRPFRLLLRAASLPTWKAALIAAAVSLAVSVSIYALRGDTAYDQDNLAHRLVAETLLLGRLANPPHPLWTHFETQCVIQQPTYASAYPPGNGAVMALGMLLTGTWLAGIWLASSAAAATAVWAARAVLPPSWSLLCGLLVALHPTFTYWNTRYVGGSLAAFGGALLFGAVIRLCRRPSARMGVIAALGIVIVENTRPYEGLFLIAAMAVLIALTNRRAIPALLRRCSPAAAVLAAGLAFILFYNARITGHALRIPHEEFDRQYQVAPNFVWQKPRPKPAYRNFEMERQYGRVYYGFYTHSSEPGHFFDRRILWKVVELADAAAPGPTSVLMAVPLLVLPWSLKRRRTRRLVIALAIAVTAPFLLTWWLSAHYVAPAGVPFAVLYVLLLRELVVRLRGFGPAFAIAFVVAAILFDVKAAVAIARRPLDATLAARTHLTAELARIPGQHVVLVPWQVDGWIYNAADIDASPVIWARELRDNRALFRYFSRRHIWRLEERGSEYVLVSAAPPAQ